MISQRAMTEGDLILPDSPGWEHEAIYARADGIDWELVDQYAESMDEGAIFPLPVVFKHAKKPLFYVADGLHRIYAWRKVRDRQLTPSEQEGWQTIECECHSDGGRRAAVHYALTANSKHGKPRTRIDIVLAILLAMEVDLIAPGMAEFEIARMVDTSRKTINRIKHDFIKSPKKQLAQLSKLNGKQITEEQFGQLTKLFEAQIKGADGKIYPNLKNKQKTKPENVIARQLDFWSKLAKQPELPNEHTKAQLKPIPVLDWLSRLFPELEIKFDRNKWDAEEGPE